MKKSYALLLLLLFLGFTFQILAQTAPPENPTSTIVVARTGLRTDAPHTATYHLFEVFQLRGKWILPDVGYIDFGTGRYHELFIGVGRTLHDGKKVMVAEEIYFDQATGPGARSARYLWPWTIVQMHFTPKWNSETVYFPYLPLNSTARIQHVLERSKIEYTVNRTWKIGGGYAGYKYGDDHWQNKPMVTTTVSTRAGALEIWLQKMPGGAQIQFRYTLAHVARR